MRRFQLFRTDDVSGISGTIVCPPELETQVRELVDAHWLGGLFEVVPNEYCPPDRIFILDTSATDPLSTFGTASDDATTDYSTREGDDRS